MDIVLLAQLTPNSVMPLEIVIALVVSIPINSESALRNAELMKNIMLILINVNVSRVLEEFKEDVLSVLLELKLLLMDQAAQTVELMRFFLEETVFVSKVMLSIAPEFVPSARILRMVS